MLASMQQRRSDPVSKGTEQSAAATRPGTADAESGFWLDAHHDPVASLKTFSTCLHSCDLYGDGDWRLAVAGIDKKLKVIYCLFSRKISADKNHLSYVPLMVGMEGHTACLRTYTAGCPMCHSKLLC